MHVKPSLITWTLVVMASLLALSAALYPLLRSPALPGSRTTADVVSSTGRSMDAMDLATMKSTVMSYDVAHEPAPAPPPPKTVVTTTTVTPASTPPPAVHQQAPPPVVVHVAAGMYSSAMVEALWIQEGGSPSTAADDACIVSHESGGNPSAISPTADYGLDQIHDDPAALNPVVSTQVAIRMSDNGTNWGPWTTAGMCGL